VKLKPTSLDRLHQGLFNTVYGRSLVYNTCWEDPSLDRVALELKPHDTVLMITSAGCNALDYALLGPRRIHAVDANPRQTALLALKIAGIRRLAFADFFQLFGAGHHPAFTAMYRDALRAELSPFARRYWDRRLHWFSGQGWRSSFYFCGLSGLVARIAAEVLERRPVLRASFAALLAAGSLDEQRAIYDRDVGPRLWTRSLEWAVSRRATMSLLGVPYPQALQVQASHAGGIAGFIHGAIDAVFRQLPLHDNYFWTVYLRGAYTRDCCPEYLKERNFLALKGGLVDAIRPHTTTITRFLAQGGEPISKFVLLDHMDWMSWYYPEALREEWQALLGRAAARARVIFRSAAPEPRFLDQVLVRPAGGANPPVRLPELLRFNRPLADRLHARDRVHTYASFHVADIAGN